MYIYEIHIVLYISVIKKNSFYRKCEWVEVDKLCADHPSACHA